MSRTDRILFSAGEAAGLVGGACRGNLEALIGSVAVDSRKVKENTLFVALAGERVDGHDFIHAALQSGASAIVAAMSRKEEARRAFSEGWYSKSCLVLVDSPLAALQALAREHRRRMKTLFRIGVTGSSGKTTTKECIAAALSTSYPEGSLVMNEGNLNSDIGLSLSMFDLCQTHSMGVFEMGMNRKGEMEELAAIYEPDMVVVTNIGTAHIGIIGSRDGIAAEKKMAFSRFSGTQRAFVWNEDPYKAFLAQGVPGRFLEFGIGATQGLKAASSLGLEGWMLDWKDQKFSFPLPGRHNLLNALAALSVAAELQLDPSLVASGLSSVKPLFGRSEFLKGKIELFMDCYNANPDSMSAALDFCDSVEAKGRRIYVLGSMKELGESSSKEHRLLGRKAALSKAEAVFFFGEETLESFMEAKALNTASKARIFHSLDMEELADLVLAYLVEGDLVLLKASRGMALERLADRLANAGLVDGGIHAS